MDMSGKSISVGGVFCPGIGIAFDLGWAWDKTGEIAPFLSIGAAAGVELGIGVNFSDLPNGLAGFDKATDSYNISALFFTASYSPQGGKSGGISIGLNAGMSVRKTGTIKGSWDYYGYDKFGHPHR